MEKLDFSNVKFDKLCKEWLAYKKPKVKESTYLNYKFKITKYLIPHFGRHSLNYFYSYDINKYIDKLKLTLSDKTVREILIVLKAILKYAERKYDVDFKLDLVSVPSAPSREIEVFNDRDRYKIEKKLMASTDLKSLGVLISLYSGLRIGEICALKWSDIDFDTMLITVTHTIQRIYIGKGNTKVVYSTPKTKRSVRKVPMSKIIIDKLKPLSRMYSPDSFILTGMEHKFFEPISYKYPYTQFLDECHVNYKNFHTLRHTFATRCIRMGMDVKSLSEILGHANVNVTLNVYVHSSYEIKRKFIDKL